MRTRILVVPSVLALLVGCGHKDNKDAHGVAVPIVVAQPKKVQDFERISVSGTLTSPGSSSMVAFLVPGRAIKVVPREGEPVKRGQLLAALDAVNLTHALEAAHAQVEAARAGALQADQEYHRMKQLFDAKSLAPNDFAKFTAARDAAREQLQSAIAGEGVARKNLADAHLVAPIDGFVARRMVEPGVMVVPGQPVFEIAPIDPIEVNVGIPETDIRLVKVGQTAAVTLPALPGQTFEGSVKVVNISADPATRTYMARISVPNPKRDLKVGMVAEVSITGAQRIDMITLPAEAIVRDPQGAPLVFQYFPDQHRVYTKRVEIGTLYGREVQILSGLKGDEPIVVAGQQSLRNGVTAEPTQGGK